MRRYATTCLLGLTILIGEVHTFWERNPKGREVQNWILTAYKPMTVQWNVKYLSEQVIPVLYFLSFWLYKRNKLNNVTIKTFLLFTILDTIMYFYSFKTYDFAPVYFWVVAIWMLLYWGNDMANFAWKHIKSWGKPPNQ